VVKAGVAAADGDLGPHNGRWEDSEMRDRSPRRAVFETGEGAPAPGAAPPPDPRAAVTPAPVAAFSAAPAAGRAAAPVAYAPPPRPPAPAAAHFAVPAPITEPPASIDLFAPVSAPLARGAVVRARTRGGVRDLACHDGALVVARVAGTDPSLVGALVGLLFGILGVVIGAVIGERIGRSRAAQRLPWLLYTPAQQIAAHDRANHMVTAAEVTGCELVESGKHSRKLTLRLRDGSTRRYAWDARAGQNAFAEPALRAALGPDLAVTRKRVRAGRAVAIVGAALLALVVVLALVGAALGGGPARGGDAAPHSLGRCGGAVHSASETTGPQRALYLGASTIDCPSFDAWLTSVHTYPASVGGRQHLSLDGHVEAGIACDGLTRAPGVVVCEEALARTLLTVRPDGTYAPAPPTV
jgi:hypothetical protein